MRASNNVELEDNVKSIITAALFALLFATPVNAQTEPANEAEDDAPLTLTAEEVDAAVALITAVGADQAKFSTYCTLIAEYDALPENDEAKANEVDTKWEAFVATLGEDTVDAFDAYDEIDSATPEGQKLDAAVDALDAKCDA